MEPSAPVLSSPSLILLLRVVLQLVNAPTGLIQRESLARGDTHPGRTPRTRRTAARQPKILCDLTAHHLIPKGPGRGCRKAPAAAARTGTLRRLRDAIAHQHVTAQPDQAGKAACTTAPPPGAGGRAPTGHQRRSRKQHVVACSVASARPHPPASRSAEPLL